MRNGVERLRRKRSSRRPRISGPRINRRIRISPVRVIADDGAQLGVMPTDEALARAQEAGLDLLEVAPNARPPVCKIVDAGKWKYEQAKLAREAKRKQATHETKQIKLRPKTDDHDLEFKTRHAKRFLEDGNKVQFVVRFRGRENAHPETGRAALDKIMAELTEVARLERTPRYESRMMTMLVAPK
ncbi:MAG: translation initiation factor IF-3 [Nannocystaceae bacterium]